MRAIVLSTVNYSDSGCMVNMFTDELGYVTASVKVSKRSAVRNSHLQPLSLLNVQLKGKPSQPIMRFVECVALPENALFAESPYKIFVLQFLSEVLNAVLRDVQRDEALFDYIFNSLIYFATMPRGVASFHLVFLVKLSRILGVFPNLEKFTPDCLFDLTDACFTKKFIASHLVLNSEQTMNFVNLVRADFSTLYLFDYSRSDRNEILDYILVYFKLHTPSFPEIKSLQVLREL